MELLSIEGESGVAHSIRSFGATLAANESREMLQNSNTVDRRKLQSEGMNRLTYPVSFPVPVVVLVPVSVAVPVWVVVPSVVVCVGLEIDSPSPGGTIL